MKFLLQLFKRKGREQVRDEFDNEHQEQSGKASPFTNMPGPDLSDSKWLAILSFSPPPQGVNASKYPTWVKCID